MYGHGYGLGFELALLVPSPLPSETLKYVRASPAAGIIFHAPPRLVRVRVGMGDRIG